MWFIVVVPLAVLGAGCEDTGEKSRELARSHAVELARAAAEDVRQVRTGLPLGALELEKQLPPPEKGEVDASTAREALEKARNRVQDLRVAKSTFFALALPNGAVLRNDREQDRMVGKNLFDSYPALREALAKPYVETRGSMPEAAEVRGRDDAQWVAAVPVRGAAGVRALYVTGWSWSSYAYRLENSIRTSARSALGKHDKMPLLYVYVVVDGQVYGAPISPDVNAKAIREQAVMGKLQGKEPYGGVLEITGRSFGLAVVGVPELGEKVAIAVLRSET